MDISIIIPVYNEEKNVSILYKELVKEISNLNKEYEIIFINDGSKDKTGFELSRIANENSKVKVISFRKNFGKSEALNYGFKEAKGDIVITMDGDLQDNPIEIPRFLAKINEGYDLVVGWKFKRKDPIDKRVASKIANSITNIVANTNIHDMNCCFKAYKKNVLRDLYLTGDMHRFIPAIVSSKGYKISEIKIRHRKRIHGITKFGTRRLITSLLDFITLTFAIKYMKKPMHFFGNLGLGSFALGILFGLYLTFLKLGGQNIGNRPLLLLSILLIILGIQLISIGLIGDMIINQNKNLEDNKIKYKLNN